MSSDDSWKAKYLRELEASEVREQGWKAERHTLGRLLARTSLASEGQSLELDRLLGELRDKLHGDGCDLEKLRRLQADIDRQLTVLDDQKRERLSKLNGRVSELLSNSRQNPLFMAEKDGLKRLEKRWKRPETLRSEWTDWFSELVQLMDRVLAGDPDAEPARRGLLERLFGNGRGNGSEPVLAVETGTLEAEPVAEQVPNIEPEMSDEDLAQRLRIARRISELLSQMLSQLALEPAEHARAQTLRDHLAQSNDWQELRVSLNDVADLLIKAVRRGQLEFEAFLKRLDERLLALQDHFTDQSDAIAGAKCASKAFDEGLRNELQVLGKRVDASSDMQELKRSVNEHIESIFMAMSSYRKDECQREKILTDQVRAMKEKLAALEAHSEQMKLQLQEERTRALTDVLTQLPNREAWQERVQFELTRWQRYRNPVTIGVIDIDHFKNINDSFGHKAGDRVIQLLAKTLRDRLRATDFVARYGGEEFVVMMPETEATTAKEVVDKLRGYIAQLPFHFRGEPVSITFSVGLTELQERDDQESVFDRADKALYQAKSSGRNRALIYESASD